MKITQFAKKAELIKLTMDQPDIVEKYGEPIDFYILDNMGVSTYFNFYKLQQAEDDKLLNSLLRKIILNEDASPALKEDEAFPVPITLALLVKIGDFLGKSSTKDQ